MAGLREGDCGENVCGGTLVGDYKGVENEMLFCEPFWPSGKALSW